MLYNILYVDSGNYTEIPPQIRTIDVNEVEYMKIKEVINSFNSSRMPYFYPQLHIYRCCESDMKQINDWIDEKREEVEVWIKRIEEREARREVRMRERIGF